MTEEERRRYSLVQSMKLRFSPEEALHTLQEVGHEGYQKAMKKHWQTDALGNVTPESICWLFPWATTGNSSANTAKACKTRFNQILDKSYGWFDRNIGLDFAREFRYHKPRRIGL
jgi:hypothetical protein